MVLSLSLSGCLFLGWGSLLAVHCSFKKKTVNKPKGEHTRGHDLISVRISKIEFNACVCAWCGKPALEASLREGSPREVCIPKYEQMSKLCGRFNVWAIQCVGEHPIFEKRTGGIHRLGAHEKTDGEGVRENECVVCVCVN